MQSNKTLMFVGIIIAVAILLTIGLSFLGNGEPSGPGQYDELALCLAEKGAIFYGAFWCPHCADQKKIFGASAKLLPYKECSTPSGVGQTEECKAAGIESYPTWQFADGSRVTGGLTPAELAEKTGCSLVASSTEVIATTTSSATNK